MNQTAVPVLRLFGEIRVPSPVWWSSITVTAVNDLDYVD